MTISTTTTRVAYDGNGATTAFAIPFPFFAPSELEVIERSIATGAETTLTLGTQYAVAGGDGATGTVTATAAPATGLQWVIRRKTARTQATDYTPNDPFPAETHEKALDRLTMIAQELGETADRALKFPKTDSAALSSSVPPSVERASKVLAFDASGSPTVSNLTLANLEAQAVNAAASATAAATSAVTAGASASAAASSATAAQAAQTAAEAAATGMKWRPSVRAASTANVNVASAPAALDGVAGVIGDRWLLKNQTAPTENGVYVFNGTGAALTRAADADAWPELVSQCLAVEQGATWADYTFICTVDQGGTIGTTPVSWSTFKVVPGAGSIGVTELSATAITGQTQDATPDLDADFALTYDASAGALKKILPAALAFVRKSLYTAKGSLITSTAAGAPVEITSTGATDGWVLTKDAAQAAGVKWAAAGGDSYSANFYEAGERQASGTGSGITVTVNTWSTWPLNSEVTSRPAWVTAFGSNRITLNAGTYDVQAAAVQSHGSGEWMVLRVRNVTDGVTLAVGLAAKSGGAVGAVTFLPRTRFTLGASGKQIELQIYSNGTAAPTAISAGEIEVYADLSLIKVA